MSKDMPRQVEVKDGRILEKIDETRGPVCTVPELAEMLPYGADGLRIRLNQMKDKGLVQSRKVGARAEVWWENDQDS